MEESKESIGKLQETEELISEEEKILAEAAKLAEEAEEDQRKINEEVERIQKDHPELVFEPNPSLIGSGVQMSPEMLQWALANEQMQKTRGAGERNKHPTKKYIPRHVRVAKRKVRKEARRTMMRNKKHGKIYGSRKEAA